MQLSNAAYQQGDQANRQAEAWREELQQALLMQHIQAIDDTLGRQGSQATVLQHQQSGLLAPEIRLKSLIRFGPL